MGDNSGDMEHNSSVLSNDDMRWDPNDKVPTVTNTYKNPGPTSNLRGVEANTNESKGVPCSYDGWGTGDTHEDGQTGSPPSGLDECY